MVEELIFRTEVNTGDAAKDTEKLTDSLKDVNKAAQEVGGKGSAALKKLNKTVKDNNFTMGEASALIEEYATIALQAGRNSPVGQEAIRMAGELTDVMAGLQTEIANAGADGQNLKAGLELAGSVTAGYGALQGAIALTGVENEELAQTFVKLQAAQSILTGIEQIRLSLEKESLVVTKAKVIWTKVATAAEYIYATAVGTTTGAMKLLRLAMLAIPIIALLAGITALVAAVVWFTSSTEEAEDANNAINASFEEQNGLLEKNTAAYKRNSDNKRKLMESELATAEELFEFDKQRLLEEEKQRKKSVRLLLETIPLKSKAYRDALKEGDEDLAASIKDEIDQMRGKYNEFIALDGQYAVELKVLSNKERNRIAKQDEADQAEADRTQADKVAKAADWAQKRRQQEEQAAAERLAESRLLEDLLAQNINDAEARKLAILKLSSDRELEALSVKYGAESEVVKAAETKLANEKAEMLKGFADTAKLAQDEVDAKELKAINDKAAIERTNETALLQGKLIAMREDFEITQELKAELALLEMEAALEQENITEGEKFLIKQQYAQAIDVINQENADRETQRQQDIADAVSMTLEQGMMHAQNLTDAFFDNKLSQAEEGSAAELAIEKKKFEINKKLQIGQAIMQGAQAVQAAYASGFAIPIVGTVTGPAFAAAAAIGSALNINKIRNTSFEGGAGGGGGSAASTPSVNIPRVQGQDVDPTTTTTQGLEGSGSQNSSATTKVTLLQSELEESMAASQKMNAVASVG